LARLPESLDVLRTREFRLLFSGQAVSVLGDRMALVALAFAVLEIGGSASDVGLVLAAGAFPLVATVLAGGVVADRVSRRAVMVAADLVRVVSQGTMAVLLIAGVADVWMLALVAGVTGAATGFFSPASTGLLPEVVLAEQLQPANGLRASASSTGEILGPVLGGVLVAAAGAGWAIAVDAVTFAVSAACLSMLRVPTRGAVQRSSFIADLREGWVAFRSRRWVWTFVLYFAMGNLLWGTWSALGPIVAERDLGGGRVGRHSRGGGRRSTGRQSARGTGQTEPAAVVRRSRRRTLRVALGLSSGGRAGAADRLRRGAVRHRACARDLRLGVDAPAPCPRRVIVPGQLL
jgi:MFS family permease